MESVEIKSFSGKNVLVTGGTGFVGSHVVEQLLTQNANIVVTYRSFNPRSYFSTQKFQNSVTLVQCDLKDKERVYDIVTRYEIEYIFHFGAQALVTIASVNPYETLASNILGTVHILEAARLSPFIKGVIVFTSDKAYGIHKEIPYTESFALQGRYPYDCSKSCADLIAQMYYATYNVPVAIVRSGNIYGPGDRNFNRIIPGAIKALIDDEVLEIRSDGKMLREYVYVKDAAYACILLALNLNKAKGEAFNLGSKDAFTVIELLDRISAALKMPIKKKILNIAKAEIPMQSLDYSKIKNLVGWQPAHSFEQAIQETYKWYSQR